uniref:Uncharacterized protein n=1 Tax=Acrobeloides nanus TaxID=290746 RepID=A0A914E0I8_9BILA
MNRYLEDSVFISSDEDSTFESENSRDSSTDTSNSSNSLISAEESETNLTPESSDLSMDNTDVVNPGPSTRSAYNRVVIDLEASQRPTTSALPVNRMNRIEMNESGDDDVVQDHRGGIPVIHSPDRSIVLLNSSTDSTFVAPSINTRSRARIIPEDTPMLNQG